ncbi:MAG: 4Fe-4S binding protein, partial [Treponema sp.]|nr:4Fe-4S binding protein [Treponema sp.]
VLDYDQAPEGEPVTGGCNINCGKCIKACPTGALSGNFSMDRGKCITQLNCFPEKVPPRDLLDKMGTWLYGCDICQDVCPMNNGKLTEEEDFPLSAEFEEYFTFEKIFEMDEETFLRVVQPRYFYIQKDQLWIWKNNTLRAMINSGEKKYHPLIKKSRGSGDPRIRQIAEWGCDKLKL